MKSKNQDSSSWNKNNTESEKNSPWLKYISIYNDKKKEKVNSFKCHVWSAYTYTTTEGKNIHTKHYIIYRNVCTSVMKPFPAKKAARDNRKPSQKNQSKIWPKMPIFLVSRLLFCFHRVTRTKKNFGGKFKNYWSDLNLETTL